MAPARPVSDPGRPVSVPRRPVSVPGRPVTVPRQPVSVPGRPVSVPRRPAPSRLAPDRLALSGRRLDQLISASPRPVLAHVGLSRPASARPDPHLPYAQRPTCSDPSTAYVRLCQTVEAGVAPFRRVPTRFDARPARVGRLEPVSVRASVCLTLPRRLKPVSAIGDPSPIGQPCSWEHAALLGGAKRPVPNGRRQTA